jgi:hypothetical protein
MTKRTEYFLNNISVKGIVANGYVGSAGQALLSDGTSAYWGAGGGSGSGNVDGGYPDSTYGGIASLDGGTV